MTDWRPIETAPKNRRVKLRYTEHGEQVARWIVVGNGREGWFWGNRFWDEQPTHWAERDDEAKTS